MTGDASSRSGKLPRPSRLGGWGRATWSSPTVRRRPSWSWSGRRSGTCPLGMVMLPPTLLLLRPNDWSSPGQELGSHNSWQNWTVATKLTVGVLGNLNAWNRNIINGVCYNLPIEHFLAWNRVSFQTGYWLICTDP